MTGASRIIELLDQAAVFVPPDPAALAEAVRQFGLTELDGELARLRQAVGDARGEQLGAAAAAIGALCGAGSLHEAFAKAAIEEAAGAIGLVRDIGLKAVKGAIVAGIRAGKKAPRDLGGLRRCAPSPALAGEGRGGGVAANTPDAAFPHPSPPPQEREREQTADLSGEALAKADAAPSVAAPSKKPRPRLAAVNSSFPESSSSAHLPPGADSPAIASPAASPAPPRGEGGKTNTSSQMGDTPEADASSPLEGAGTPRGAPPDAPVDLGALDLRLGFFPLTDLGNAERFAARWKDRLRYNTALGWLVWDGKRWSAKGADEFVMLAEHRTVRGIQDEARAVRESGVKGKDRGGRDYLVDEKKMLMYSDKIAAWGRSSESAQRLGALSKRGAPYFAVGIDELDADKMKINVNNGTLTVRRRDDGDYVSFAPHDPADLITKLSPVDFDPEAVAPEFAKFLERVQPLPEMRAFLPQWFGLSLTGDVSAQKLAFLYGKGGNGKSVLVDAVSHVAGDYGETVPIETFLDQGKMRNAGQATPDLAILPGVRMLRTSEPEKNSKLAEALVKLVTGGEPIQARHLNRDFFKFYPQFKLTISGNYRPTLSGTDEGIRRRLMLVPFDVTIPKDERDRRLADKLRLEASGILNWMLDGLRVWLDKGLIEPDAVTTATTEYFSASDPLGRFLATCVMAEPGHRVQSSVLHQVYEAWCKSSGETAWKNRGLSLAMDERGYKRKQSDVVWWLDIKLIRAASDFVDQDGNPIRMRDDVEKGSGDVGDITI
jgi:putative DNA primase/helicase